MRPNSTYRGFKNLADVKVGELFYDYIDNTVIYKMIEITFKSPTKIEYVCQQYKTNTIIRKSISTNDIDDVKVLMFNGRDRASFFAGYRFAIQHCKKYMGVFDLENAELNDDLTAHMRMLKVYKNWCNNETTP